MSRDTNDGLKGQNARSDALTSLRLRAGLKAISRSSVETSQVANALPFPAWTTDAHGLIEFANAALASIAPAEVGMRFEEVWARVVTTVDRARATAAWARMLSLGSPLDLDLRAVHADQLTVTAFRVQMRPVKAPEGTVRCWIGTAIDIQDLRNCETALERTRGDLERLRRIQHDVLETVAHDLRGPLNAMLGWTRLLKKRTLSASVAGYAVGVLERQIELQVELANELMDLAGMLHEGDTGSMPPSDQRPDGGRFHSLAGQADLSVSTLSEPQRANDESAAAKPSGQADLPLASVTVLVVEDDSHDAALAVRALEAAGADVHRESSALSALTAIRDILPDVLVAKVELPIVDGWTFIRQVRTWDVSQGGNIPAVSLARTFDAEHLERSQREGFQQHLVKPVDVQTLVPIVARLVGRAAY